MCQMNVIMNFSVLIMCQMNVVPARNVSKSAEIGLPLPHLDEAGGPHSTTKIGQRVWIGGVRGSLFYCDTGSH